MWVLRINIHFDSLNLFPDTDRSSINTIKTNWSISQISDFVNFLPLTFQLAPVQCWQHINQLSSSSSNTNIIITCFCAFHSCRREKAAQMIPERQYRPLDQQSARRYFVKFNPGTEHDQILNCLREHNSVQLWVAQTFSFASTRWTAPWPDFTYLASFAFAGEVLVLEYLLPEALVFIISLNLSCLLICCPTKQVILLYLLSFNPTWHL